MANKDSLHPAYVQGLAARNRLTDARDEVYRLLTELPTHKRRAIIHLYNQLCSLQGTLEHLLEDIPAIIHADAGGNGTGGHDE